MHLGSEKNQTKQYTQSRNYFIKKNKKCPIVFVT